MAFGHASKPTRKYAYGCREFLPRPVRSGRIDPSAPRVPRERFDGHAAAVEQLFKANRFQNKLVEIELARRAANTACVERMVPMVRAARLAAEALQLELESERARLRAENSENRAVAPSEPVREMADEVKALFGEYYGHLRSARASPEVKSALAVIDAEHESQKSQARLAAVADGLYWATSLQVCQRVKKTGPEPRFKRFDGTGTISVQFQRKPDRSTEKVPVLDGNGKQRVHPRSGRPMTAHVGGGSASASDMFRQNHLCWIERARPVVPYRPECDPNRNHVTIHFRVGSKGKDGPVWAHVPATLHRELPEGTEVKWAHLTRRAVATHWQWSVAFDVARDEWPHHPAGEERAHDGTVAVSLGWRLIDGMVRAGQWVGSDGVTGYFAVPADLVEQWKRLESLQSIRDRLFDRYKELLVNFLRGRELSDEWVRRTESLSRWNSPKRLAGLVLWWRSNRLTGDDDAYVQLEGIRVRNPETGRDVYDGWRKQDKHVADWQAHMRNRLIRWRNDLYRHFGIGLSYQYKSVVCAEIDWHDIAAAPQPETGEESVSKANRSVSACATLREHLNRYMEPISVPASHITDTCSRCNRLVRHPGAGRWIACERCGNEPVDRAENAARNLLSRAIGVGSAM